MLKNSVCAHSFKKILYICALYIIIYNIMKIKSFVFFFCIFLSIVVFGQTSTKIDVRNLTDNKIQDYIAEIPLGKLKLSLGNYFATNGREIVPVEISTDIKGNQTLIFPVSLIREKENKLFEIKRGDAVRYPKRTYAELSHKIGGELKDNGGKRKNDDTGFSWVKPNYIKVSGNFKDHAYYIKYEGPGWESDMVAFRFYLDQRNAIDVFGKKTPGIILPQVGIDNYENYHRPVNDWGVDQMEVGKSLGIGSIAFWDGEKAIRVEKRDSAECYVQTDGKIRSQVMTTYYGWNTNGNKRNLKSLISIDAGSRASHMELLVEGKIDNLATGFIKKNNTELMIKNDKNGQWSYIASWGRQSMKDQYQESNMMGLAVFVRTKQLKEITEDESNHIVVLNPENGYIDYYFMPVWEFDWKPIANKADFQRCIDEMLVKLNNPVIIK